MNIYELVAGPIRHFVAAESEEDAYAQGTDPEAFPDLHFRPFDIRKVGVEGYTITVTQIVTEPNTEAPRNKGGRPRKASN